MTDHAGTRAHVLAVIIPVRNRPELLRRALESVVRQLQPGVSVVVVDDGSEPAVDPSLPLGDAGRIVRIEHAGVCAARNAGVDAAGDAQWITFLDSDDEVRDGWVTAVLGAAASGVALFSCGADYLWDDGRTERPVPLPLWAAATAPRALFLAGTFAVQRRVLLDAGGYRVGLRHGENTDLGWRITAMLRRRNLSVVAVDEPLVLVHARRRPHDAELLLESAQMLLADPPEMLLEDRRTHASYFAIAGVEASRLGRRRLAMSMLAKAVRTDPRELRHLARWARAAVGRVPR